ncbi:MAG: hypothetical protein EPN21_05235 [Methylococcaceae bacterium]|nr:MAG: hypothetical protein EPN21_05235 [Methylococcaceae bacterium]
MNKKLKVVLFVLFVVFLYVVTMKVIMPIVFKVMDSGLYLKKTEDDPVGELRNARTYAALLHCENQLRESGGLARTTRPSAGEDEYKAWGLGDHTYVIKAMLDIPGQENKLVRTSVACKIKYDEGDESDPDNWSILGVGAEGG